MFTSSAGTIDLAGTIRTVNHGRFQQAFGTAWISKTSWARTGSVSTVALAGSTNSSGKQVSALAAQWMAALPAPVNTEEYAGYLRNFERMLYCRRCALFSYDGLVSDLETAIADAFDLGYLFRTRLRFINERIADKAQSDAVGTYMYISRERSFADIASARLKFDSANQNLEQRGFGKPYHIYTTRSSTSEEISLYEHEFGSPELASYYQAFGRKHMPGTIIIGATLLNSAPKIFMSGMVYMPVGAGSLFMTGRFQSCIEQIYDAAGIP